MIQLRPYQQAAVEAVYDHLRTRDDNPCVVIPTAGGKTPVMATICKDAVALWGGRVLVLAHVKELLEQTADKLAQVCPEVPFGIYSAGLGRRDTAEPVIVAGIQSVYRRAGELDRFDLILVDEAHLIPPDGEGMYRSFLADAKAVNPNVRLIGLTATPYRMRTGSICAPENLLNHVCYEVGVRDLVLLGFLCKPTTRLARAEVDTSGLHVRAGEYVGEEVEALMDTEELVRAACAELAEATRDRNSVLLFASGVPHAEHLVVELNNAHGIDCGLVTGETPPDERAEILKDFREGRLKYLANVNVLTTGFDAPGIDCVAILRPTLSPGLYYQMVGRGFRLHPGKEDCLVLDFGNNVMRHGPVDRIQAKARGRRGDEDAPPPAKLCPDCRTMIATGFTICPECGHEFPPPGPKHAARASGAAVLSSQQEKPKPERHAVLSVQYSVHTKRGHSPGDGTPQTLRVDYQIGICTWVSEWVCIEHDGFAGEKAARWWRGRSRSPLPESAGQATWMACNGYLATPLAIEVLLPPGEKFERVVGCELGPLPDLGDLPPVPKGCRKCGGEQVIWTPGSGPNTAREDCAACGAYIRWVPAQEVAAMAEEMRAAGLLAENDKPGSEPVGDELPPSQHAALFEAYQQDQPAAEDDFPFGANVETPWDDEVPF